MNSIFGLVKSLAKNQKIRFLAVGATNTVVGYGLFALFNEQVFRNVPFGYLYSLVISYAAGIAVAFLLYRKFVFVVVGNWWLDLARFVSVYLVSIAINFVALPLLVSVAGINALIAQAAIVVITTLVSFFGHRNFSFYRRRIPAEDESTHVD